MNLKIGTQDARNLINEISKSFRHLRPQLEKLDLRSGLYVDLEPVEPESTDDQREGFHVLLDHWMRMDPRITATKDELRHYICTVHFGVAVKRLPGGQEIHIPARTTTKRWDHDRKRYFPAALPRDDYSALIDLVYRMAAEDGIVLPELERDAA